MVGTAKVVANWNVPFRHNIRFAVDVQKGFRKIRGFSTRKLRYMRAFATAWPEEQIVQQLLAQITWAAMSRCLGLERLEVRESYAPAKQQHGWRRNVLVRQIESVLHGRVGREVAEDRYSIPIGSCPAFETSTCRRTTLSPSKAS